MSGFTVLGGSVQTAPARLTTTLAPLFVAKTQTLVVGILAVRWAGTPTITIERYSQAENVSRYVSFQEPFPTINRIVFDLLLSLKSGDEIRAAASVNDAVDMFITYLDGDKTALGSGFNGGRW